ncbi:MAG: radical SAM protein [Spirochaetia bacterium]|nr:radical SAM protein [Spirochaetia bacterium]
MYHFFPHTKTYSIGMLGCNMRCQFCQNYHISQKPYIDTYNGIHRVDIPHLIDDMKQNNSIVMSYTYSEPIVWQDSMISIATEVKKEGMYNLVVTNGTFSQTARDRVTPLVDAMNIDLKGDEAFYAHYTHSSHAYRSVIDSIQHFAHQEGIVLEITTLIIEPIHTKEMIEEIGKKLKEIGVKVWHLSRFFPNYKMKEMKHTSVSYLEEMVKIAINCGIEHVYRGNVSIDDDKVITCASCGTLIERSLYKTLASYNGKLHCPICNHQVYGNFNYTLAL